jgi:diguanylate cyclase (GGDEF)-like protein/PAS domain S-box-containing protein
MNMMRHFVAHIKRTWQSSIRRQLSWTFSVVSLLIVLGSGQLLLSYQANFLYQQGNEQAVNIAKAIALSSWSNVLTENLAELQDNLIIATQAQDAICACIISQQGELLATTDPTSATQHIDLQSLQVQHIANNTQQIDLAYPIKVNDYTLGWVRVIFSRETANANLQTIAITGLGLSFFLMIVIIVIANRLAHRLTDDIEQLATSVNAAKEGRNVQRIALLRHDEIGILTQNLYQMLDTITIETNRRQNKESQLVQERDFINTVLDTVGAIILVIDRNGEIVRFNTAAEQFTGYRFNEVENKPYCWSNFLVPEQRPHIHELFENIKAGKVRPYFENDWLSRNGNKRLFAWSNTIMLDNQGDMAFLITVGNDISERKAHEQALEHSAHHDALTQLPNRMLLMHRLQGHIQESQTNGLQYALVFIDLDGFKAINDTYGHDAGDQLLIAISARITHVIKESDTLARMGGDEFVAIITDLSSPAACIPIVERLLKAASEPVHTKTLCLQVSASIGVTFFPQAETSDRDGLLHQADQAMYCAKKAGKNGFCYFDAHKIETIDCQDSTQNDPHQNSQHEILIERQKFQLTVT